MLVTWRYHPRGSLLEKLDPRTRWITSFLILFSITWFWDIRFLLFFFVLIMVQYAISRLTWHETRRAWIFILFFIVIIVGINALISGRAGPSEVIYGTHTYFKHVWVLPLTHWKITLDMTLEKAWFTATQMVRMLSMAILFFIIPYTVDPRSYGISFSGMKMPDRFAFSADLAFRFVPSLARDFSVTLDAQRARGYEVERVEGGLIRQIQKVAPLVVPVTMNAILSGEDITNAMDLRCFGLKKRTWIDALTYQRQDKILIGICLAVFIASSILNLVFKVGNFWIPAWFLNLVPAL
jgi:energy-coupling factor transport system permease protein